MYSQLRLNYSSARYLNVGGEHFERHNLLLKEAGLPERKWEGLPGRITEFLEEHLAAGTVVRKQKGHGACRKWIAGELGFPMELFVTKKAAAAAVDRFNADLPEVDLQARGKFSDLHLRMAEFLQIGWRERSLKLGPDGVDRLWLARQFGVHNPIYVRYPKTREAVDAFDESIRDKLAESPTHPTLAADLRALIATLAAEGGLPVFKDRLNETELARRLGVYPSAFQLVPECMDILAEAKAAVRFGDPLRPYHDGHGRNYAFHDLVPVYGVAGATRLAKRFCDVAGPSAAGAKRQYALALALLIKVGGLLSARQVDAIGRGTVVRGRPVEAALRQWRSEHLAGGREQHLLSGDVLTARALVERMRLFADATDVLVRVPNAGTSRPKRSLAEAPSRRAAAVAAVVAVLAGIAGGTATKRDAIRFFARRGEEGLAAFLFHVDRDHGGLWPRSAKGKESAEKVFHSRIVSGLGGARALEGLPHLTERAVAAACLAYTCEAGANSSVARGLQTDCMRPSEVPGHREVTGWKDRGAKPIVTDLPVDHRDGSPSAIGALDAMLEAHGRLARLVDDTTARHLFLADTVGRVQPIAEHRLLHLLREIVKRDPTLGEFDLRVDMIRSSVLLDAALSADGNISVANALANHTDEGMTSHYVLKMPLRIIYERKIREFQNAFEAVVIVNIEGAAERLGLSVERLRQRFEQAMPTGLGRMCLKPTAGVQPGTKPGERCMKPQACPTCRVAVVIADVDLVTDLIIWHGSLVEAAETWEPEREERFIENWLDDLAFCDAAIAALGRGPHVRVLRKARDAAARRLADPNFERPRPW